MGIKTFLTEPNISDLEKEYVLDALNSGWINVAGKYVEKLEQDLASYVGAARAASVGSGTAGLMLALKALGIGSEAAVLTPTITFIASTNAIAHTGATPIFIDCDSSLNIDPNKVREYLEKNCSYSSGIVIDKETRKRVKAIMPVHIFGNPCDMVEINAIAKGYGLYVIEDACEALGTITNTNQHAGMSSTVGVYSFSFNKMITTGNGGAVVSRDPQIVNKIKYLSTQAKDDPENWIHGDVGYNLGLSNILAALGCAQLERIDSFLESKKTNFEIYKRELESTSYQLIESKNGFSNYWFYALQANRSHNVRKALKEKEIQTRPLFYPNHMQKPYKDMPRGNVEFAESIWDKVINLPCSTMLTEEEIIHICDILNNIGR